MIYLYSLLTIVSFMLALQINKYLKSVLFNTFILTLLLIISLLVLADLPYDDYMAGNAPLNNLMGLSVVALALPLYQQVRQIARFWKEILLITCFASFLSMLSVMIFGIIFGASADIIASISAKSVTMPIAMEIAHHLGGEKAIAAVGVVLAGLQGSILGYFVLQKLRIKSSSAMGLAIGSVSHVMGTVSCMEVDSKAGNYSSISLVLCGIISAILAPLLFKLVYFMVA